MKGGSEWGAVTACGGMTVVYVAVLYSPTLIFRRPPAKSYNEFMMRRFICALFSSLICLLISFLLLTRPSSAAASSIESWKLNSVLSAYGVRTDHFRRAAVYSITLTSLMYAGSMVLKSVLLFDESWNAVGGRNLDLYHIYALIVSLSKNITAWRNLVVAPITEELVFRACMIPLLLCGGFLPQTTFFLCPLFFSLSHLNHLLEFYSRKNCSLLKTSLAVGHLIAPLVAHIVCNFMGLPIVYSKRGVVVSLAFVAGAISFLLLLVPLTAPALYNSSIDNCRCWQGYCSWR